METMVNTYNPEWICAWNGNMDLQLCLDYFAVITYISDYYCKDDTGTMQMLQEALKESRNDNLKTQLQKMVSVFLTHRHMGESEAYYRILPSMNMKYSSTTCVFAQTGFNPSRFLEKLDERDTKYCEKVIQVQGRTGKYQEKPSLYDKYLRRDCISQPYLQMLSYAQFVKCYQASGSVDKKYDFKQCIIMKEDDSEGEEVLGHHIITPNYGDEETAIELPQFIRICDLKPGELPYMKRRSPQVLRYHKFNKEKNPHEYHYSELQLYHPHGLFSKQQNFDLQEEKENFEICKETYLNSAVSSVKQRILPFVESVEEGLEQAKEQNIIGDELDPQNEQDRSECEAEGLIDHPDFAWIDPDNLETEKETSSTGLFKTVIIDSEENLHRQTQKLDPDQQIVFNKVLNFACQIKASRKTQAQVKPPLLIVQGGAGSGKSLLIRTMAQWFEKILRQSGDDPDKPYILLTAFTGTAAANIDGMTLHSAFNFNFGNEFLSLGDKTRDQKREYLKNLKLVTVDEFSMLKADMLYQLDLRLRELKQDADNVFGGCSVLLLGDALQLRPVMGRFVFEEPLCEAYHLPHLLDPLWKKFKVILLTKNHRQGEDRFYAEILNRIRTGDHTDNDCNILKQRVRPLNSKDIPSEALYVICINAGVNKINEAKLENLNGKLYEFLADVRRSGKPTKKPRLDKDGSIFNTPLQYKIDLKIGAKVMLTYNVNTIDSLTNGALGKVIGFEKSANDTFKSVLVQFNDEKVGREKRKNNSSFLQQKYPGIPVTPISRIEFRFNLSKNPTSQNDLMTAVQFPLKLAFACTAHKMQGSTILKPNGLVADLKSVREAAQGYVILSRVQCLQQLFILDELPKDKFYPSEAAMLELNRLKEIACNKEENDKRTKTLLVSLNIRSLPKHHKDLLLDRLIGAEIVALQETWCEPEQENHHLALPGYNMHLESQGFGKGVVTYFQEQYCVSGSVNKELYQMIRVTKGDFHVINVYCSRGANKQHFFNDLMMLTRGTVNCMIVGDFNENFLQEPKTRLIQHMLANNLLQLVDTPTHSEGGLLDHVYVKGSSMTFNIDVNFRYYSDHAAITVEKAV